MRHAQRPAEKQSREEEAQEAPAGRTGPPGKPPALEEVKISHERAGHRGAFVWIDNGERLAEMTYTVAGSRVIIDHTDVDDRLRGKGAGKQLVKSAVEWARAENVKLMALCPFAKSVFDKTPAYADVLVK